MRLFNFKHLHEAGDWFNFKVKPNKRLRVCLSISEAEPEPAQESERRAPDCHFSTLPLIKYHWSAFAALQRRNGRKGKLHPNHWTQKQNKRQGISLDSTQPPKEREISVLVLCFNVRFKGKRQREDQRENLLKQFQKFLGDCCWFYYIIFSSLCTQGSFFFFSDVQRSADSSATPVRPHCPLLTERKIHPLRHLCLVPKYGHDLNYLRSKHFRKQLFIHNFAFSWGIVTLIIVLSMITHHIIY